MKYLLTYIVVLLFFFSCKCEEKKSGMINIPVYENAYKDVHISELIDSIRYVEMVNDTILTGAAHRVFFTDSLIYVAYSSHTGGNLICFDREGNFKRNVYNIGHANNEVIRIKDIDVSEKYVILYENERKRILYFSHDGSFVRHHSFDSYFGSIRAIDDENMAIDLTPVNPFFPEDNTYQIVTVDKNFNVIDKIGNYNGKNRKVRNSRYPYFIGNTFLIPYENICYRINEKCGIDSVYYFDLGDKAISPFVIEESTKNDDDMILIKELQKGKVALTGNVFESDDLLTLRIWNSTEECNGYLFYDKKDNIPFFINSVLLDRNDMLQFKSPNYYDSLNDEFVYILHKISRKQINESEKLSETYKNLNEDAEKILVGDDSNTNTILAFVKFKKLKKENLEKYKVDIN